MRVTWAPKSPRIDASWQPDPRRRPPATDAGSRVRSRSPSKVSASSAPGIGSRPGRPPTATTIESPPKTRPSGIRDRVRVDEQGRPDVLDHFDAVAADQVNQSPLLVRIDGEPSGVAQRRSEVPRRIATQAELSPRPSVADQPGGPGQRADRTRPFVRPRATEPPRLDQRDVGAELTSLQRHGVPAGPPPRRGGPGVREPSCVVAAP